MSDYDVIKSQILFEDNHLIILNKLPSQIVQGDKTGDEPLSEKVKAFLKKEYKKPGNVYLGVAHRLDRPVSGVLIFAKTSKALSRLNKMIREKQIKKTYWAVVKNLPPADKEHIIHYLIRNQQMNKSFVSKSVKTDSKKAELIYKHIKSSDKYHLLEVELLTGRHHQIRAQLSFIGCPIKGDVKYGYDRTNKDASIHLHARRIEFVHPVSKQNIAVEAEAPKESLWNYFST